MWKRLDYDNIIIILLLLFYYNYIIIILLLLLYYYYYYIIIIIIIIIKKGRQCKAERDWYTPYQSEDPSPTIPTYRQKEEKREKE